MEKRSASVLGEGNPSSSAKQAEDTHDHWSWAEPSVWTKRMLTALDTGVKGGKWFSLMDKVYARRNLDSAFHKVTRNKGAAGVDHQTIAIFAGQQRHNLERLSQQLQSGTYQPQAVRRVWIPKPGTNEKRPLGIPTVRDRVVQTALRNVLEPIFERDFAEHSYGFRPGRGCSEALDRVQGLLEAGYGYAVDVDLKSYFDTIPHHPLLERISTKISDGRILEMLRQFLEQGVMDGLAEWTPTQGSPQGAVISPLLSNIYLDPLDHHMADQGFEMVRYADDFVILCRTPEDAQRALVLVEEWTASAGLTLHPTKTRVVDAVNEGFEFLGYRFHGGTCVPRDKSIAKLKESIRTKTRRKNGKCLQCIIANVNRILRGWFNYFQRSESTPFERLDGWIRMRLRTILRKRMKRKGRARCLKDHKRWPNAFFKKQGLYSLLGALESKRQSAQAGNH